MVIVSGHLIVDEDVRDDYLAGCADVVEQARRAPGCLDFAISADLLDPAPDQRFRTMVIPIRRRGVSRKRSRRDQAAMIVSASVSEYDVSGERRLT